MDNNHNFDSAIIDALHAGTWEWNVQTGELKINERWAEMIGYTLEELEPISISTWLKFAHPEDLKRSIIELKKLFSKEIQTYSFEARMKHKDGHWIWVLDSGSVVEWTESGKPLIALGAHLDITQRKEIQFKLQENERMLRQIIDNSNDIIYRLSADGKFTYLSIAWQCMFGYTVEESIGESFEKYIHPEDLELAKCFLEKVTKTKKTQQFRGYRFSDINGQWIYLETNASPIIEDDIIVGFAGVARDITELIKKQKEIEYLSYHDQLTRFKNRHFLVEFENEINKPENFPLTVISIDINDLKVINDKYGHHRGDQLIQKAAEIVQCNIPFKDYMFRMGGDEFLIFLPQTTNEEAKKIKATIEQEIQANSSDEFPLSLAIGFHIKETPSLDLFDDVRKADQHMYKNKEKSKKKILGLFGT
jgi:diguanylate cyclase (GGDEF)-like protein/PAS domain S-box-containing protein